MEVTQPYDVRTRRRSSSEIFLTVVLSFLAILMIFGTIERITVREREGTTVPEGSRGKEGKGETSEAECDSPKIVILSVGYDPGGYVVLYNPNTFSVDLSGWILSDDEGSYQIPYGTFIARKTMLTIFSSQYNPWPWRRGRMWLDEEGDHVALFNPCGKLVDIKTWTKPKPPPLKKRCDPSYPDVCIPPPPPDLDCKDIPYRNFRVLPPDPHHFDADRDGIGCETGW